MLLITKVRANWIEFVLQIK